MKINYQILCVVLLICIGFLLLNKNNNIDKRDAVLENIFNRTSVREYTDKEISNEDLELLVKAGMSAPTAGNMQPWEFIVIKNKKMLKKLGNMHKFSAPAEKANAAIIVLADMNTYKDRPSFSPFWITDTSVATQNILLAAHSMGIGAVWLSVYPWEGRPQQIKEIIGFDENKEVLDIVVLGYPKGEQKPKDKWKPEKISWRK